MPAALSSPDTTLRECAKTIFFIVGCGRSGTTLLQSALSAHPEVVVPPETKFYPAYSSWRWQRHDLRRPDIFRRVATLVWEDQRQRGIETDRQSFLALAAVAPADWDGLFLALLAAYAVTHGRSRIGEKSPAHTPYVGHLAMAFPEARFVHVLRDPRAVVHSRVNAGFGTKLIGPNVDRWREAVAMHHAHAERLGPERYRLVRYETLVQSLEPTLRDICDFLGIEFTPEMLTPHERAHRGFADRSSAWMENTLKPVFTSSVDKWRTTMPPRHVALVEAAAGADLAAMGYEPTGAGTRCPALQLAASRLARLVERTWRRSGRKVRRIAGSERK